MTMEIRGSKVYVVCTKDVYEGFSKPIKVFADKKDAENFVSWETYEKDDEWDDCQYVIFEHFIE